MIRIYLAITTIHNVPVDPYPYCLLRNHPSHPPTIEVQVSSSSSVVRVRVYDRREESVYKSIGEVLFVVRARKRGRKGRRARDGVEVKVYRGGRREDLELSHSNFGRFGVRRVVVVWF